MRNDGIWKKEIKCKACGTDISIKSLRLWKEHKIDGEYYCKDCYDKIKAGENPVPEEQPKKTAKK